MKFKEYSDLECEQMIRTMTYPVNAPSFVVRAIREKRRKIERKMKNPQKEMEDFMEKELGSSKIVRE